MSTDTEDCLDEESPRDNVSGAGRGAGVVSSSSSWVECEFLEIPRVQLRVICGIWRRFDEGGWSGRGVLGSSSLLLLLMLSPPVDSCLPALDRPVKSVGIKRRLDGKLPLECSSRLCSPISDCCCCCRRGGSSGFGDCSTDESPAPLRRIFDRRKEAIFGEWINRDIYEICISYTSSSSYARAQLLSPTVKNTHTFLVPCPFGCLLIRLG